MTQVAYGDRAIPKINRELQATELIVRQRALVGLCDMLHGKPRALIPVLPLPVARYFLIVTLSSP